MKDFPEELRGDIAMHLYREALSIPVLASAPQGCLKRLAFQGIRYRFCTPGEFLLHRGDHIASLSFICAGSIEILKDGLVVAILGKGDLFGTDFRQLEKLKLSPARCGLRQASGIFPKLESVVKQQIQTMKSQCDVRALTYCDLQLIDVEKLYYLLLNYEEYACHFYSDLANELTYNLAADDDSEPDAASDAEPFSPLRQTCDHVTLRVGTHRSGSPAPSAHAFSEKLAVTMEEPCAEAASDSLADAETPADADSASSAGLARPRSSTSEPCDSFGSVDAVGVDVVGVDAVESVDADMHRRIDSERRLVDCLCGEVQDMRNSVNILNRQFEKLLNALMLSHDVNELDVLALDSAFPRSS